VASTPLSSTATVTPVPSYPAAHAAGAPTCGTLCASAGWRRPSSQIVSTPTVSRRSAGPPTVKVPQKDPNRADSAATASASTVGSSRVTRAPPSATRSPTRARSSSLAYATISGSSASPS
jgi:hypothetical protein